MSSADTTGLETGMRGTGRSGRGRTGLHGRRPWDGSPGGVKPSSGRKEEEKRTGDEFGEVLVGEGVVEDLSDLNEKDFQEIA